MTIADLLERPLAELDPTSRTARLSVSSSVPGGGGELDEVPAGAVEHLSTIIVTGAQSEDPSATAIGFGRLEMQRVMASGGFDRAHFVTFGENYLIGRCDARSPTVVTIPATR